MSKGYPKFKNNRVYINKWQYFEPIAPEEYNFQIGGFKPMEKWLKDRKGRTLNADDLFHYMKMHKAIKETISLMEELKKFC
ncbi:MAG: type ISP restriction/modification enzyme [Methanosarcinales archaeon]